MNSISRLLSLANIVVDLDLSSKKRLFEEIAALLENTRSIKKNMVFDGLVAREKLGSTGLGYGVAIPHGRIKSLQEALGVFVKMKKPLSFDAPELGAHEVTIDAAYVRDKLEKILGDEDLSRYIL